MRHANRQVNDTRLPVQQRAWKRKKWKKIEKVCYQLATSFEAKLIQWFRCFKNPCRRASTLQQTWPWVVNSSLPSLFQPWLPKAPVWGCSLADLNSDPKMLVQKLYKIITNWEKCKMTEKATKQIKSKFKETSMAKQKDRMLCQSSKVLNTRSELCLRDSHSFIKVPANTLATHHKWMCFQELLQRTSWLQKALAWDAISAMHYHRKPHADHLMKSDGLVGHARQTWHTNNAFVPRIDASTSGVFTIKVQYAHASWDWHKCLHWTPEWTTAEARSSPGESSPHR